MSALEEGCSYIGIIGSGRIGSILARHLAALGHQVRIANPRGPESLAALAAETDAIDEGLTDSE